MDRNHNCCEMRTKLRLMENISILKHFQWEKKRTRNLKLDSIICSNRCNNKIKPVFWEAILRFANVPNFHQSRKCALLCIGHLYFDKATFCTGVSVNIFKIHENSNYVTEEDYKLHQKKTIIITKMWKNESRRRHILL